MNNAKLWLVVSPSVGIPVFLGAVAVGSFAVHLAVLSKTNWYSDYLVGDELGSGSSLLSSTTVDTNTAAVAYAVPSTDGGQEVLIVMPDGSTATAILKPLDVEASARTEAPPLTVAAN